MGLLGWEVTVNCPDAGVATVCGGSLIGAGAIEQPAIAPIAIIKVVNEDATKARRGRLPLNELRWVVAIATRVSRHCSVHPWPEGACLKL